MNKICLNMIVKNEAHVIERCLRSVKPFIHCWVIVDTGSTDGTQELIRNILSDIPGELYERPWVHFEHNRNEALSLAAGKAEYLLFIDADEELRASQWPILKDDCYFTSVVQDNGTKFSRMLCIKDGLEWFWQGVVHEMLKSPLVKTIGLLQEVSIRAYAEGARSKDPKTYSKDARMLEQALEKDPNNRRNTLFLALYYEAAKEFSSALATYQRRVDMQGDPEEVFYALYRIAVIREMQEEPIEVVIESFLAAHFARSSRLEPLYWLIQTCKKKQLHWLAYLLSQQLSERSLPEEKWYLEESIYQYGWLSQKMHSAYIVQRFGECKLLCEQLVQNPFLSPDEVKAIQQNLLSLKSYV